MINIFNELYTLMDSALKNYEPSVETSSVHVNMPSKYPFVSLEEIDDSVYQRGSDSCELENYANKQYEVNIYTKNPNKKSVADNIAGIVDNFFKTYNFVRTFKMPMQSIDETTYQIIIRYEGIVSKDHTIYRR